MATTPNSVVTPQTIGNGIATLTSPTAITVRANIVGTTGLVQLKGTTTNGTKVYEIKYKAKETTVAGQLFIWRYNGTTAFLEREITVTAVTASTTVASDSGSVTFDNLALISTESLWVSSTIDQDFNVFAQCSDL